MPAGVETALLVFGRAPERGRVKTRLIPALGAEGAALLHERMLRRTLRSARRAGVGPVYLYCAPGREAPFFRQFAARLPLRDQSAGDLGARMHAAFRQALRRHRQAILIGTDCPALRPQDLRAAASALSSVSAVLAPAEDGGYPLIGLCRVSPRLFRGVDWGGPRVLAQTRRRLAQLRWRVRELRRLWDVDRPEDALRLRRSGLLDR
jgi:rSAM/selenodomain-associated transferase 1